MKTSAGMPGPLDLAATPEAVFWITAPLDLCISLAQLVI